MLDPNKKLVCSHGVYLITHLALTKIGKGALLNPAFKFSLYKEKNFENDFNAIVEALVSSYRVNFSNNKYPLSIFKNFKYCRKMRDDVSKSDGREFLGQIDLFDMPKM